MADKSQASNVACNPVITENALYVTFDVVYAHIERLLQERTDLLLKLQDVDRELNSYLLARRRLEEDEGK